MTQSAIFTVTEDGVPVVQDPSIPMYVQFYTADGMTSLTVRRLVQPTEGDGNWAAGQVGIEFTDDELAALSPPQAIVAISSQIFVKRFKLDVQAPNSFERSDLFIKDVAVDELRKDQLALMAANFFSGITFSDDFLWQKLLAAESETATELRVPLVPTQFYGDPPSAQDQATFNPTNLPWQIDPDQDYDPDFFTGEKWGFIKLRFKPVIQVQRVRFVYPSPTTGIYDFPLDWIRLDRKYAQMRFVPASSTFVAPLNAFLLQALGGGRSIPFAFQITYQAGIGDVWNEYPQLIDVVRKRALLKMIEESFVPGSGSISADGLSQSMGMKMQDYRDFIDVTLNGPKGRNGGLKTALNGIQIAMLGQ